MKQSLKNAWQLWEEDGSRFSQPAPAVPSQKRELWFSDPANALVKLHTFVPWAASGCPRPQGDCGKALSAEGLCGAALWASLCSHQACRSEAVCQLRITGNDRAGRCDFSKYCRMQGSGLTLGFINPQNSVRLLFQKGCCKLSRAVLCCVWQKPHSLHCSSSVTLMD